jgi:hypothetical protein
VVDGGGHSRRRYNPLDPQAPGEVQQSLGQLVLFSTHWLLVADKK